MTSKTGAVASWLSIAVLPTVLLAVLPTVLLPGCLPTPEISLPELTPPELGPPSASCAIPYPDSSLWGRDVGTVLDPTLLFHDESGPLVARSLHAPCQSPARLLVLRVTTAWCGPCLWQAAHTRELLHSAVGDRIQLLDVVIRNSLNRYAQVKDLAEVRQRYDEPPHLAVGDGTERITRYFGMSVDGEQRFPMVVLINQNTMEILAILSNPDPDRLLGQLRLLLARADGLPAPLLGPSPLYDGRFTRDRWEQIKDMQLRSDWQPPPDPTNRVESSPSAAALGRSLFMDVGLTRAGAVGCVTCHSPATAFQDGLVTARGIAPDGAPALGDRNTPWLGGVAANRWLFWDGRADTVWAQVLGPFENDKEMSSDRMYVARTSLDRYRAQYEAVFGPAPELQDPARFPASARPGMDSWKQMTAADQHLVSGVFANLGKALAAYLRGLRPAPVALDRYAAGDQTALSDEQKDGLVRFFEVGCIQCHFGPQLTDASFHSNYFPTGRQDGQADLGRLAGLPQLLGSEFRGNGPYSDAPQAATWLTGLGSVPSDEGQFRSTSLRGVADTAPYTHGGQMADLKAVISLYATAGQPDGDARTTGLRDLAMVRFDKNDPRNELLVQFLRTLKATITTP